MNEQRAFKAHTNILNIKQYERKQPIIQNHEEGDGRGKVFPQAARCDAVDGHPSLTFEDDNAGYPKEQQQIKAMGC